MIDRNRKSLEDVLGVNAKPTFKAVFDLLCPNGADMLRSPNGLLAILAASIQTVEIVFAVLNTCGWEPPQDVKP